MKDVRSFKNDRRDTKRYDMPVKIAYLDPATNLQTESMAKNICKNGLRFPVSAKMQKGTVLDMKIENPFSAGYISSKAEIVWIEELIAEDTEDMSYDIGVKLPKKRLY